MKKNAVDNPKLRAETFKARFLESGVVEYLDERVLIKSENLLNIALKFKGAKVIIDHKEITAETANQIVGYINNIWIGDDGWAWCDFTVNDEEAIDLINRGYSVSCCYVGIASGSGGTKNAVPYDREIIDIEDDDEVTHLAIVETPRYEDAIILKNSIKKTIMQNIFKFIKKTEIKENSAKELDLDKSAFEIDGEEVPVSKLMSAYKNQKDEEEKKENEDKKEEVKINADHEFEIDGKMVKISEMAKAFKAAKKNTDDEDKKNAEDEEKKNADDEEEEEKKKNEEDDKKKEAKKNSADAEKITKAKAKFENGGEPVKSKIITDSSRFALGTMAYGEPQKVTK